MNKIVIGIVSVALVALSGLFILNSVRPTGVIEPTPDFAASSGPAVVGGCMDVNGVSLCAYKSAFSTASTTCSFKPSVASSTLVRATVAVSNARGGTFDVEFGKASNPYATTTTLGNFAGITTQATVVASTSQNVVYNNPPYNFSSGDYLNIKIGSTTHAVSGTCSALFMSTI